MAGKSESKDLGIYLDSGAFAKLYVPEPESGVLVTFDSRMAEATVLQGLQVVEL